LVAAVALVLIIASVPILDGAILPSRADVAAARGCGA
jgi:hypothetical protein